MKSERPIDHNYLSSTFPEGALDFIATSIKKSHRAQGQQFSSPSSRAFRITYFIFHVHIPSPEALASVLCLLCRVVQI